MFLRSLLPAEVSSLCALELVVVLFGRLVVVERVENALRCVPVLPSSRTLLPLDLADFTLLRIFGGNR